MEEKDNKKGTVSINHMIGYNDRVTSEKYLVSRSSGASRNLHRDPEQLLA